MPILPKPIFSVITTVILFSISSLAFVQTKSKAGNITSKALFPVHQSTYNSDKYPYTFALELLDIDNTDENNNNTYRACTGTIIHATEKYGIWGITGGHCTVSSEDGSKFFVAKGGFAKFGTNNLLDESKKLPISNIVLNKNWIARGATIDSLNAAISDVSLVKLGKYLPDGRLDSESKRWLLNFVKSNPSNLSKPPKIVSPSASQTAVFIGSGRNGVGIVSTLPHPATQNRIFELSNKRIFLGGENTVVIRPGKDRDRLFWDFDAPDTTGSCRNLDGSVALPLEYTPLPGDSGGPIYLNNTNLIGLISAGQLFTNAQRPACSAGIATFGSIGWGVKLDQHKKWIFDVIFNRPNNASSYSMVKSGGFSEYRLNVAFCTITGFACNLAGEPDEVLYKDVDITTFTPTPDTFRDDYSDEEFLANEASLQKAQDDFISDVKADSTPTLINFTPSSGSVGTTVRITGSGLKGVSSVVFYNGRISSFISINQDGTEITATVPDGAVSGKFQLLYPNGRLVSPTKFIVTP